MTCAQKRSERSRSEGSGVPAAVGDGTDKAAAGVALGAAVWFSMVEHPPTSATVIASPAATPGGDIADRSDRPRRSLLIASPATAPVVFVMTSVMSPERSSA